MFVMLEISYTFLAYNLRFSHVIRTSAQMKVFLFYFIFSKIELQILSYLPWNKSVCNHQAWKLFILIVIYLELMTGIGKVNFDGFCQIASHFLEEDDSDAMEEELREAFRLYDKEGELYEI